MTIETLLAIVALVLVAGVIGFMLANTLHAGEYLDKASRRQAAPAA